MTRLVLLAALSAALCVSQSQPAQPAFEVATVKPSKADDSNSSINSHNGRLSIGNVSLKQIIEAAYRVQDYQVSGAPGWLDAERYNIEAKAEENAGREQLMPMLQTLLIERFHL